jgi:cyclin H
MRLNHDNNAPARRATMKLSEDDLYRTSTQFTQWSFTPQQLADQRLNTNIQATERVKANVARQRAQRAQQAEHDSNSGTSGLEGSGANTPNAVTSDREVDCLSVAEEMMIVDEFCERAVQLGAHCNFPIEVTATCIQFLRRFYLYNSPMTYHGQNISRTAMFLACKTENAHQSVETFAGNFKKVTAEQILAPEYLIVQALRFNFEIKHPFRALKGGHLELMEMARGKYDGPNHSTKEERNGGQTAAEIQVAMLRVPRKSGGPESKSTIQEMEKRITDAYGFASHTLKNAAVLTDVYFLYTPAQIWLAAHLLADEPLTLFYLSLKVPSSSPIHAKILNTLRACAGILSSHRSYAASPLSKEEKEARDTQHKAAVKTLIDKLKMCRDPDKVDLVKLNQAQKRDAVQGSELDENKAKRRKLDREKFEKESDSFWGPELSNGAAH